MSKKREILYIVATVRRLSRCNLKPGPEHGSIARHEYLEMSNMKLGAAILAACILSVAFLAGCGPPPPGPAATPTAIGPSPLTVPRAPVALVEKIALILDSTAKAEPPPECTTPGCEVAERNGCLGCHTIDGAALVGPSWMGIFGKEEDLEGGGTVKVDAAYIEESIRIPDAKIVKGFPKGVMLTVPLTQEEIAAVISYIESLK